MAICTLTSQAQDVDINIISQENSVNDGVWFHDAAPGTTTVLVTVCNNDARSTVVPSYKLRPLISVPGSIVQLAPDESQTGLPPGWTILSNTGSSIRLSNGTDQIPAGECREIVLHVNIIVDIDAGPLTVTGTMAFSNGVPPGSASGPQTGQNLPGNDNSTTTIQIVKRLPVTLVSFNAAKESKTARLTWSTTEETNSDYFEIQRSNNGKEWAPIGKVSSNGESTTLRNYSYTDRDPLSGDNFYRLRMVDKDLTFAYSSIRNVKMEGQESYVYPNPVSGSFEVSKELGPVSDLTITDLSGKVVHRQTLDSSKVNVSKLRSGMYVVKMQTGSSVFTQKIVVKN